jgi:hypothetical protein
MATVPPAELFGTQKQIRSLREQGVLQDEDSTLFEKDERAVAILADPDRKEFLANVEPMTGQGNAFATGLMRYTRYRKDAERRVAINVERYAAAKEAADKAAMEYYLGEIEKWQRLVESWQSKLDWVKENMLLTGSVRGLRAQQILEAIVGGADDKDKPQYVVQAAPMQPQPEKRGIFRR